MREFCCKVRVSFLRFFFPLLQLVSLFFEVRTLRVRICLCCGDGFRCTSRWMGWIELDCIGFDWIGILIPLPVASIFQPTVYESPKYGTALFDSVRFAVSLLVEVTGTCIYPLRRTVQSPDEPSQRQSSILSILNPP